MALAKIELVTLDGSFTGAAANVYPNAKLINFYAWAWDVWIVAVQFSTTLTIYPTDFAGMILTMDQLGDPVAIAPGLKSVIAHVTGPGSLAGPPAIPAPSSKVSNIVFGGCGYFLQANSPISIYAFANTTASGNSLYALASIQNRRAN